MKAAGKAKAGALRAFREAKPWTQAQLAAAAGLSTRTIMRVEAGAETSAETLLAIGAALGVPAYDLMEPGATHGVSRTESPQDTPEPHPFPVAAAAVPRQDPPSAVGPVARQPKPQGRRFPTAGRLLGIGCLGLLLACAGTVAGLQAAWVSVSDQRALVERATRTAVTYSRARDINLLAARYSTLLPREAPERDSDVWKQTRGWSTCDFNGEGLLAAYQRAFSHPWLGGAPCTRDGMGMTIVSRDERLTELIVGPAPSQNIQAMLDGLSADPSIRITVSVASGPDRPTVGERWTDARSDSIELPRYGVPAVVGIRLSGADR